MSSAVPVSLVASVACHYNSTLPQLCASDVCFDLFGREQDLPVAYSRDGEIPEFASSN